MTMRKVPLRRRLFLLAVVGILLSLYLSWSFTRPLGDLSEAARRVASSGSRPLLGGGDAVQPMRRLLAEREGFYRRADATVSTDGQRPEVVAEQVVALARSRAGW